MKRLFLLLALPILACGGLGGTDTSTNPPLAGTGPVSETESAPAPDSPTEVPPTELENASAFPNSGDYEWSLVLSWLGRPVDIQPAYDGSGRLFIIEKRGYIRVYENGQLLETPF